MAQEKIMAKADPFSPLKRWLEKGKVRTTRKTQILVAGRSFGRNEEPRALDGERGGKRRDERQWTMGSSFAAGLCSETVAADTGVIFAVHECIAGVRVHLP